MTGLEDAVRLYESGRYAQAANILTGLDEPAGDNPRSAYYLGLCYVKLEKYEEALIYLEQVVTSSEEILHVYQSRMLLGYIYTLTGRFGLARFEFEKVLEMGFESVMTYSALGFVAYSKKKIDESISYFERGVEMDGENANALNSLGYTLAESGRDVPRAVDLCRRAVKKHPDYPPYMDSLGWALFQAGDLEEARSCLRKALDGDSGNRTIAGHLKKVIEKIKSND
ncbi:MAG: tetratricopeptide repeat protein [Spirochaetia bacterium]